MKKNTTLIIVGVVTLGVGAVVYYNWEWIQKNLLGKVGLSKAHGTVQGIIEQGEGIAMGSVNTDADELVEEAASSTPNFDEDGNMITAELDNLVFPSYEEDVWVKTSWTGVQIHKVDSGTYQFVFTQQGVPDFSIDCSNQGGSDTVPITSVANIRWKFGNTEYVGPYQPSERPVASFPETGIYEITVSFDIGNDTDGYECGFSTMKFDMQVVL